MIAPWIGTVVNTSTLKSCDINHRAIKFHPICEPIPCIRWYQAYKFIVNENHIRVSGMNMAKSSELYEEKREYPRIVINSPVNILYKIHQLEARIHDISPEGIQIRADGESLKKINLCAESYTDASAPLLDVTFSLKLCEMDMRINALCKMYYSDSLDDVDDRDTACGLKFINFEGDGSSQLDAFIIQEMMII